MLVFDDAHTNTNTIVLPLLFPFRDYSKILIATSEPMRRAQAGYASAGA
jgi:hypothetical protein